MSPLDPIVHDAARKLLGLRMTRIVGSADLHDAKNLNSDLDALCSIIDPVILAVGQYAKEHLGISERDVRDYFTDQLRGALEGNATFEIEEAGKDCAAALRGVEPEVFA